MAAKQILRAHYFISVAAVLLLSGCSSSSLDSLRADAQNQFNSGNHTVAARLYREILDRQPDDGAATQRLAASLFAIGDFHALAALSADIALPRSPTPLLLEATERMGASPDELSRPTLTDADIPYLQRVNRYHRLALRLTRGLQTGDQKLQALFDWTARNIQSAPIPTRPELPAWPSEVMLRGYGACDRSAWVFASLARQVGFPAYLVVLHDPESDLSPHTLAGVLRRGRLLLFDTFYGIQMTDLASGDPAGLNDLINRPGILAQLTEIYPDYRAKLTHFQNAIITVPPEPWALTSRMSALQSALNHLPSPPRVFLDLDVELEILVQSLYGHPIEEPHLRYRDEARSYSIDLWGYPFDLRREYERPESRLVISAAYSYVAPFANARTAQLSGNFETAARLYSALLSSTELAPSTVEDASHFRALATFDLELYTQAAAEFRRYLTDYPNGAWGESAAYNMTLALEKAGDLEAAARARQNLTRSPKALGVLLRPRAQPSQPMAGAKSVNP